MTAAEALDADIPVAARGLREGRFSITELVTESLSRIEAISAFNAYTEVFGEQALALARAHEILLSSGYDLGPLHGLPVALKDNIDMAGVVTTAGSIILKDNVAVADATVAAALKRAGAIIVGRNNMHEFGWGGTTANPHYGTTGNAWDAGRSPSGSSGGSATAVAMRTVFGSLGTDTGGSIRNPAALSGVSGLRPTIGRVSNNGVFPLAWTLDTTGPIARSSRDCAVLLQSIAGHDPGDPQSAAEQVPDYYADLNRPLTGGRLGRIAGYSTEETQPAVRHAFESTLAIFSSLGATITEVTIPDLETIVDALIVLNGAEPSALHGPSLRSRGTDYGPDVRVRLDAGLTLSATDYIQASRYRTHIAARFAAAFGDVDALLTPTLPFTAPRIGQNLIDIDGHQRDVHKANMRFTALASVPGLPALSVPMGFDTEHLPIGLQILSAPFEEARILRIGHQLQTATSHHLRFPAR